MLKMGIKNKAAGSYLSLVAALVALVTAIVFLATQATAAPLGHDGTAPGVVLLAGVAAAVVLFIFPIRFGALIQAIIYNIALYLVVVQLYFVFADVINNVTFAGGNAGLCVFYMMGTLVCCLLSVVACFFKQTRDESEAQPEGTKSSPVGAVAPAVLLCVIAVCVGVYFNMDGGISTPASGTEGGDGGATAENTEGVSVNYTDNTFKDMSLEDLAAIPMETWEAKEADGQVAYYFEGQYTEGFSTIVDPACLDMYCCTDGSMYGSFSGPTTSVGSGTVSYVYGYWYNYDENGEYNFVIHITGNQDADGTLRPTNVEGGADADVYIFDTDHGAYNWEASLSYGVMGGMITRNINIYGQVYTKAQSLTIDSSALPVFYTGDSFDATSLVATAVRGNGAEESIWNGRISYSGFDSETPGTKTVTASFLGATATFDVTVEELVADTYTGSYELVVDGTPTATEAQMVVDYSHKTCTVTSTDGTLSISGTVEDSADGSVTITLNGSEPMTAVITESDAGTQITIPAHQEVVSGWGTSETYEIGECTMTLSA
ncbi:bacterial Ig-like domain-containing protein [uncultured Pseudoflavonifractor sp.]|uniref:bacterial Ig-like domain-containing protein n=1 Tax=uncultured Pseudoflavonifractor sp. TaxID=1221379 RepID=UPI0025E536C0|nr:bacterial Ig-like domain-containing protein [uncultured Pseudoflavonifractor sp.]